MTVATLPAAAPANPLLADTVLPDFPEIRPEHVEPAIRALLDESRASLAGKIGRASCRERVWYYV